MGAKSNKLNARQQLFVEEYLVDLNCTRAAIRAGYSESYADAGCAHLLRDSLVGAAVKKAMETRARRIRITADRVLREYARIAFADIRRVIGTRSSAWSRSRAMKCPTTTRLRSRRSAPTLIPGHCG
jgi:Terminase small subunit